jgi:hypothetical protein
MTRWLPRSLWLLAWSFWAWLGWGLYRELPRSPAPVVRTLSLKAFGFDRGEEQLLGFIANGPLLATFEDVSSVPRENPFRERRREFKLRVRDPDHDIIVREAVVAAFDRERSPLFAAQNGIILASPSSDRRTNDTERGALDLRTGSWTAFNLDRWSFVEFHPTRAWALFTQSHSVTYDPQAALVVDLRTGRTLFEWHGGRADGSETMLSSSPRFLAHDDSLWLPIAKGGDILTAPTFRVEIRSIHNRGKAPRVFHGLRAEYPSVTSESGRLAWRCPVGDPPPLDVFDARSGAVVLAHPSSKSRRQTAKVDVFDPEVRISPDGRGVLCDGTLWDVDSGRPLWTRGAHEVENVDRTGGRGLRGAFWVAEVWDGLLGDLAKAQNTRALRDLATGRVLLREWVPETDTFFRAPERVIGEKAGLMVDDLGDVRSWPPPANWGLNTFFQTILSLPLILTWLALRWRHKRRLRMASALP